MAERRVARLGDLCSIEKGQTGIASATPGEYPLVTTAQERRTSATFQFDAEAVCIPLVSSTGHGKKTLNYIHYQSGKFALGTILAAVIPKDPRLISTAYIHRYLQYYKMTKLVSLMKGAANVSLAIRDIANVTIELPTLKEQKDFVCLYDKSEYFSNQLSSEYSQQETITNQLRQSILQEAIEGKLTVDWRTKHPYRAGDSERDGAALLEKIREEKKKLVAENKIRKEKLVAPIAKAERPFELPVGWVWCRLSEVSQIKGGKRVAAGYKLRTIPTHFIYIRVSDMKNGSIDFSDLHYIDTEMHESIKKYIINCGEIYITIVGATIGKCGIIPNELHGMNLTENAARIILGSNVKNTFLVNCLNSIYCQTQLEKLTKRVGVQKLALYRLSSMIFPLPPLAEQAAIVERVEALLAHVDELEKEVANRKEQTAELMREVLREAFEG